MQRRTQRQRQSRGRGEAEAAATEAAEAAERQQRGSCSQRLGACRAFGQRASGCTALTHIKQACDTARPRPTALRLAVSHHGQPALCEALIGTAHGSTAAHQHASTPSARSLARPPCCSPFAARLQRHGRSLDSMPPCVCVLVARPHTALSTSHTPALVALHARHKLPQPQRPALALS